MTTILLRHVSNLRRLSAAANVTAVPFSALFRGLHSSSPFPSSLNRFTSPGILRHPVSPLRVAPPFLVPSFQIGVRWKTKQTRARAPDTPVKSKVKKYKIKGYSSYKRRFKPLNDGTIRRWKEGNAHNAYCKETGDLWSEHRRETSDGESSTSVIHSPSV